MFERRALQTYAFAAAVGVIGAIPIMFAATDDLFQPRGRG